jgi:hypothetical protein
MKAPVLHWPQPTKKHPTIHMNIIIMVCTAVALVTGYVIADTISSGSPISVDDLEFGLTPNRISFSHSNAMLSA